jgi:hypothetical protein
MIDFSIRNADGAPSGLYMSLLPGVYRKHESCGGMIVVGEGAFGFLEPSIAKVSAEYSRPYSHWGVTALRREEWALVLVEWGALETSLTGGASDRVAGLRFITRDLENEFLQEADLNYIRLADFIREISLWLLTTLENHDVVSVLGI